MRTILAAAPRQRDLVFERAQGLAQSGAVDGAVLLLSEAQLGPPVPDPEKIVCLGLNYRDHAEEADLAIPKTPMLFAKFRNSLIGPNAVVELPYPDAQVDYEAELAVVIGRRAKNVPEDQALNYVYGAMSFNDVTARDAQLATSQWMAGKAIDTFAPCGPSRVPIQEIGDLQNLRITCRVNGLTVQDANTSLMVFDVASTIAFISRLMTLEPGDIIATGTPAGVGFKRKPPVLLKHQDTVEVEIEKIATLTNPVIDPCHDRGALP